MSWKIIQIFFFIYSALLVTNIASGSRIKLLNCFIFSYGVSLRRELLSEQINWIWLKLFLLAGHHWHHWPTNPWWYKLYSRHPDKKAEQQSKQLSSSAIKLLIKSGRHFTRLKNFPGYLLVNFDIFRRGYGEQREPSHLHGTCRNQVGLKLIITNKTQQKTNTNQTQTNWNQ